MLVKRFLTWIQSAPAEARAGATATLARAWLGPELSDFEKADAVAALTLMLDDPDVVVRQALADVFADLAEAPRHIVLALAGDVAEVAVPVLMRSPLLADGDLVQWVATREVRVQCAVAARRPLSAPVAAALAEVGEPLALAVLASNPAATIAGFSLTRMAERHGDDDAIAQALLAREDLAPLARFCLLVARNPHGDRREAQEKAAAAVAASLSGDALATFVRELRARSLLTVSLLLRGLASGDVALFEAVLAELSSLPRPRVAAIAAERRGAGFAALCRKVGLPDAVVPVLKAALAIAVDARAGQVDGWGSLCPPSRIVERIVASEAVAALGDDHVLVAALRRLSADFARDEARRVALALAPRAEDEPLLLDATMAVAGPSRPALLQDNAPREASVPHDGVPALSAADAAQDEASADGNRPPAPSYAAMAALLEETVAAALANMPPPAAPREEREVARKAVVIEGEWVGVAVERGFDPGQFGTAAAA